MEQVAPLIELYSSAWSFSIVLIKKNGIRRFYIDFRKINELTERNACPLTQVTARYLSTLDLKNEYWQIALTLDSHSITAPLQLLRYRIKN